MISSLKEPVRVVQYGMCHEHAGAKMQTLKRLEKEGVFRILGVVDDRASKSPRTTQIRDFSDFDGVRLLSEGEFMELDGVEAAIVETTNADLLSAARVCLERGLAMHLDKPCGETPEPYAEIVRTCARSGIPLQMGYVFRSNPAMRLIREIAAAGGFGEIFSIEADMDHDYGDDGYQRYIGTMRGGLMYNLCCHIVDFACSVLPGEPVAAHSVAATAPGDPPGVANNCVSVLEWGGAIVTLRACSRVFNGFAHRRLRVDGTLGTAELSPLERFDGRELVLELDLKKPCGRHPAGFSAVGCGIATDRYAGQFLELAKTVRGEIPWRDMAEHDLRVHRASLLASGCRGTLNTEEKL